MLLISVANNVEKGSTSARSLLGYDKRMPSYRLIIENGWRVKVQVQVPCTGSI
jgi:hypothetical protein